jgi:membrane complex biogenesis BtpA family protein
MVDSGNLTWLSGARPALIGMVHLAPLPGTPRNSLPFDRIIERAIKDAHILVEAGFDALLVENMGDAPYLARAVGAEIIAAMTAVTTEVVGLGLPVGVQVLAGANHAALSVATMSGAHFIRAEGFAFSHVADEGWMDGDAGALLRYRRQIKSTVAVYCDVQKKHSAHSVTADLSLMDWIEGALFCGADGVVVTGRSTGHAPQGQSLSQLTEVTCPVFIGSGITPDNVSTYSAYANGLIVGSYLKTDGNWQNEVCNNRANTMRRAVDALA